MTIYPVAGMYVALERNRNSNGTDEQPAGYVGKGKTRAEAIRNCINAFIPSPTRTLKVIPEA